MKTPSAKVTTSSYVRRRNQRRILESVLRVRSASRAELARVAGMSQPTVSRIVDELLSSGILMEDDATAAGGGNGTAGNGDNRRASAGDGQLRAAVFVGRPSTPLVLDRRRPRFLAMQLGVYMTRLAVLPTAIPDADKWDHEFATPGTADEWSKCLGMARDAIETRGVKTVVVSVPGVVDENSGRVFLSPNLRWAERADLPEVLRAHFRTPVLFVQEIRALVMGHLAAESESESESGDFLLVDTGTGVGAAAVAGGRLYSGPLPLSGELGHIPVLGNQRVCGCGSVGCLETLISRNGILASARQHGYANDWQTLTTRIADEPMPRWFQSALEATAVAIASALNVLGLRQVVLTGWLSALPEPIRQHLHNAIRADTMWARFGSVVCRSAPRRRLAGMISLAIDRTILGPRTH